MVHNSLYVHAGQTGHEIVFAAPIRIRGRDFALDAPVAFEDGVPALARWFPLDDLRRGAPPLFPRGLTERL